MITVIVYFDTGFFVDCFSKRSLIAVELRTNGRRDRTTEQVQTDAYEVIKRLNKHHPITSVITVQEYAKIILELLKEKISELPFINSDHRITSKSESLNIIMFCEHINIKLEDLNNNIFNNVVKNPEYLTHDLYDAIHLETARIRKAKVIISGDDHLLKFDNTWNGIRIIDTDEALRLL